MDPSVAPLLKQIEQLGSRSQTEAGDPGKACRRALLQAAQKLCITLQDPGQLVEEFLFGSADNLLIKVAVDLKIFKRLSEAKEPVPLTQLAESTKCDVALLNRIMRGLASFHAVEQIDDEVYAPSKITNAFASTKGDAGARLFYELVVPGMQPIPKFLAETSYKNPTNAEHLPFNLAFGPQLFFPWVQEHPEVLGSFLEWMAVQREGHTPWLEFYPFEQQVVSGFRAEDPHAVLLVDVGGNTGHEIREIRQQCPSLRGRMVLQDLPSTIAQVKSSQDMEAMAHDFFTPQPVEGARVYYLRSILHDWDDAKCTIILQNIASAMKPGYSKVLINEFSIPGRGASAFTMRSDFMVMALAGAVERTENQWHVLLNSAGLKIDRIWTAEPESESIIEASLI
ncbi:o-methyltransferas-like protein [Ophiobolus disseminans]|uniref:O-methyltransferas-like protein n=1 Tax=Ophiobolus disseminans TaxID=1469910 RepID=A0A6A7A9M7_9PLEO|nr:o-methyltransferas-like protein [Ophiobolus disseminans]